jgi:response regulator RpfG family c-di-GMP phosphodiesterase
VPTPPGSTPASQKTKRVCDVLVRDKLLKPEQVDQVVNHATRSRERVEEVVLDLGMVGETDLLKSLAANYRVFFASSEKLAKAEVAPALVHMIPQRFAEQMGICPIVFDAKTHTLTVVTADPDDADLLREAQLASGAREIKAVFARPAAVRALISKAYAGDARPFAMLDKQTRSLFDQALTGYGRHVVDFESDVPPRMETGRTRERVIAEPEPARPPSRKPPTPPLPAPVAAPVQPPPAPAPVVAPPPPPSATAEKGVSGASFVELLHVLVSLLETSRADLHGHSAQVARLMRRIGDKMGLDAGTASMLVAGAFVHDLGKMGALHLTPLNVGEYEGHKIAAQKSFGVPARLLDPVRLPAETKEAVAHMYERYDGRGFPDGTSGKDIPLGARLLAICDTYADLTSNPRNPFRKTLSPVDAVAALAKYQQTIFDPNLVDIFRNIVLGEELTARLLASRSLALIVDVDPEETTVLELRMSEQGFVVKTVRSQDHALKVLAEGETDLVISEIDLGSGDGLALLAAARGQPWGKDMPWVIYTRRQEREVAQKAFEFGVLDYVTKPAPADVLVAKLKALLDQRASPRKTQGVSGSLREMGLPDMVQVLFHGRKTGNLRIRAPDGSGEIHFVEGNVVDALWRDLRGENAFYALVKLVDGDFALDPSFRASERVINQSAEALLLEGMRRMDEGLA